MANDGGAAKYAYYPSLAGNSVFVALFAITTLLHLVQMLRTRTWFMIPFVIGGIFEVVGYAARDVGAKEAPGPYESSPFILQTIFLLVAPALLAASIYMTLGRIVELLNADALLIIRRTWLTKIFVGGDIASFILQAAGAAILTSSDDSNTIDAGKDVILIGLFVQIIFFGLFTLAAALFHFRIVRQPTLESESLPWKRQMLAMYIVCLLIFVRSIIRVVEYIQGPTGYITTHEWCLFAFDGALMFLATAVMGIIHPGVVAKLLRERAHQKNENKLESGSGLSISSQMR